LRIHPAASGLPAAAAVVALVIEMEELFADGCTTQLQIQTTIVPNTNP